MISGVHVIHAFVVVAPQLADVVIATEDLLLIATVDPPTVVAMQTVARLTATRPLARRPETMATLVCSLLVFLCLPSYPPPS